MLVETYTIGKQDCALVYYKRHWFFLPLKYIPPEATVSASEKNSTQLEAKQEFSLDCEMLDPETMSNRDLSKLCLKNNIPIAWVVKDVTPPKFTSAQSLRLKKRKNKPISGEVFRKMYKELKGISEQRALIIKILWEINKSLSQSGSYITLEALLRLKVGDVIVERRIDPPLVCIGMKVIHKGKQTSIVHYLPTSVIKFFFKQKQPGTSFVFSNRDGGPLYIGQMNKDFREATKRLGLKHAVTTLSLRPTPRPEIVPNDKREFLIPVTQDEWEMIWSKISLKEKRGCRPIHNRIDMFNAMLHCLRTGSSMRSLSPPFPQASAVVSLYKRWKKRGIFEQLVNFMLDIRGVNSAPP